MTFYLKYRPQKIEDLDSKEVRETLKRTVKSGKIPHAFLFSGPKGSGKTSAARILAKVVNCERGKGKNPPAGGEPCDKCGQCKSIVNGSNIDVIELDAASHRGVDDVRTIRGAVKLAPAKAKKKVYIIDEAHMLTTEASNALLKTLEEPPEHVMFILATTNPEKLIETIRSRTVNVVFKKASVNELVRSLEKIVKGEKIKTERETLELIAKSSGGSFRDAAKILDQLVTEKGSLKKDVVEEYLFQKRAIDVDRFLTLLAKKDTKKALQEVENVVAHGASMSIFLTAVIERLRSALLAKIGMEEEDLGEFSKKDLILLIKFMSQAVSEIPKAVLEQIPVELAVIEWCQPGVSTKGRSASGRDRPLDDEKGKGKVSRKSSTVRTGKTNRGNSSEVNIKNNPSKPLKVAARTVSKSVKSVKKSAVAVTEEIWTQILTAIRPKNTSTEALLRAARPLQYDGNTLTLGVFYKFHKEKLETRFHRELLEDMAGEILGSSVRIECTLTEPPKRASNKVTNENRSSKVDEQKSEEVVLTDGEDDDIIKVAKEIFGN